MICRVCPIPYVVNGRKEWAPKQPDIISILRDSQPIYDSGRWSWPPFRGPFPTISVLQCNTRTGGSQIHRKCFGGSGVGSDSPGLKLPHAAIVHNDAIERSGAGRRPRWSCPALRACLRRAFADCRRRQRHVPTRAIQYPLGVGIAVRPKEDVIVLAGVVRRLRLDEGDDCVRFRSD